jgi:hypothetical protein
MEVRGARIAIGLAVVLVAGCSAILGLEDNLQYSSAPDDSGADGPAEAGSDGALIACADGGGLCRPRESNWTGPLSLYSGPENPACPGGLPSFSGKALLDVADAGCGCACASACPVAIDTVFYTDLGCTTPCGTGSVSASTCSPVDCADAGAVFATFDAGVVCTATSNPLPPPVEDNVVACDPVPLAGDCPAGLTCYANPAPQPFGAYCVSATQVTTCPSDYPYALVTAYGRIDDTRTCACTCTPPSPADCSLAFADSIGCAPDATVAATACTPLLGSGGADAGLQIVDASDPGPCTPAGGLTGAVTPVPPSTLFCCAR